MNKLTKDQVDDVRVVRRGDAAVLACNCGRSRKCPELRLRADGQFELKDDYGGSVVLTAAQIGRLQEAAVSLQQVESSEG